MTSKTSCLSRRTFVGNSALALGSLGALLATEDYGAETASPTANQVNARQYGAKGDGSTDDTKALQAALDAAKANGPICYFPPGLYRLNGPLMVPPGVTLAGLPEACLTANTPSERCSWRSGAEASRRASRSSRSSPMP